MGNLG